jgi:hypothetical protein
MTEMNLVKAQQLNLAFVLAVPQFFRGDQLVSQLEKANFECRIIPGINAASLSPQVVAKMMNQKASKVNLRRNISTGEGCCALVHLDAYKEFLKTDNQWVLVLEDDVALCTPEVFLPVFSIAIDSPTILKLSTLPEDLLFPVHTKSTQDLSISKIGFQRIRFPTNNADAYFVNRAAALIAVERSRGYVPHYTADWPYLWDSEVEFWTTKIKYAEQKGDSLIDINLERSYLAGSRNSKRTIFEKVAQNTCDLLFVTSIRLQLAGGSGIQYYKNRVIPKLFLWMIKFRSRFNRDTKPSIGDN